VGKVLVEKLLWSCPDIENIYVVVRGKKGKGVSERIEDIIKTPAFDRIREKKPQVINKIVAFEGDITLDGLGMSNEDLKTFYDRVNVIFHSAASIKFNDPIKIAVQNNVLPTKQLLAMGHKIKQLDVRKLCNFGDIFNLIA
jgi:alcohol-forming fatty acyl-CoA reductase